MKPRVFQVNPEEMTPDELREGHFCLKCGHWIDIRLLNKTETTRWFFEHICKFCQRETPDPNPERTKRINTSTPWTDYKKKKRAEKRAEWETKCKKLKL